MCIRDRISAVKPQAAFYMFPKIDTKKFNIVNDEKFALDLLRDKKILIVQGSGFNWHQPDHFRVCLLYTSSVTDTSMIFITPIPPTNREMLAIQISC